MRESRFIRILWLDTPSLLVQETNFCGMEKLLVATIINVVIGLVLLVWIRINIRSVAHRKRFVLHDRDEEQSNALPSVTIIIPARDEERNIGRCLEQVSRLDYPELEIIVVDDRSTDRTAQIASEVAQTDPRIRLIHGKPLADGWVGKSHAVHQGACEATGDWLLLLDADIVELDPQAVTRTMGHCLHHDLQMLSLLPQVKLGTFWEKVVMPVVAGVINTGFPLDEVNDPESSTILASGAFILLERSIYEAIGGYPVIKDEIPDDVALARLGQEHGLRYHLLYGRQVILIRMYTNLREIWLGWTKNLFRAMHCRVSKAAQTIVLSLLLSVFPFIILMAQLVTLAFQLPGYRTSVLLMSCVTVSAISLARISSARYFGYPWHYFITHPLGSLVFMAMVINSAWRHLTGRGVAWKGRTY